MLGRIKVGALAPREIAGILATLETAFAHVPRPASDRIVAHRCFECDRVGDVLERLCWKERLAEPFGLLGRFRGEPRIQIGRDFVALLTVEAAHYFLPLLLAAVLCDAAEADVMLESVVALFAGVADAGGARSAPLVRALSEPEQRAVAAALESLKNRCAIDGLADVIAGLAPVDARTLG